MKENSNFKEKYYNLLNRFFKKIIKIKLFEVDFTKPWWKIVLKQKFTLVFMLLALLITESFYTLIPAGIVFVVTNNRLDLLLVLFGLYLFVSFIGYIIWNLNSVFQNQIVRSVYFQAHKYFLTVDPIFHTTRSSGQILSKIDRGSAAFEYLLDTLCFEIASTLIAVGTLTIALASFNLNLGLTCLISSVILLTFNVFITVLNTQVFEPEYIKSEDETKAVSVENLQQIQVIRSTFATNEIAAKLENKNKILAFDTASLWNSFAISFLSTSILEIISVLVIAISAMNLINSGQINVLVAGSLLITYLSVTKEIHRIGRRVKTVTENYVKIQDLYTFIRGFGKQTFPVLEGDAEKLKN